MNKTQTVTHNHNLNVRSEAMARESDKDKVMANLAAHGISAAVTRSSRKKVAMATIRECSDFALVSDILHRAFDPDMDKFEFLTGGNGGADALAERFALQNGIPYEVQNPDWERDGKSAAFKRNERMLQRADEALVITDGRDAATLQMISLARRSGKRVRVFPIGVAS